MPQWNCTCENCRNARLGVIPSRTQSSVALSAGQGWWLVNASPDLRAQIEVFSELQPQSDSLRNSPIQGVLLTNADLDHLLGLFSLREGERLEVIAPREIWRTGTSALRLSEVLKPFCDIVWREPEAGFVPLSREEPQGVSVRAIPLQGKPPPYAKDMAPGGTHSVAYQFMDPGSGGRLLVAPDVAALNPALLQALAESKAVVFDGTFWSAEELIQIKPGARTAQEMGHLTIRDGSLEVLRKAPAAHKIYAHINNTNPILASDSAERRAVEEAGVEVGYDGLFFEV